MCIYIHQKMMESHQLFVLLTYEGGMLGKFFNYTMKVFHFQAVLVNSIFSFGILVYRVIVTIHNPTWTDLCTTLKRS